MKVTVNGIVHHICQHLVDIWVRIEL